MKPINTWVYTNYFNPKDNVMHLAYVDGKGKPRYGFEYLNGYHDGVWYKVEKTELDQYYWGYNAKMQNAVFKKDLSDLPINHKYSKKAELSTVFYYLMMELRRNGYEDGVLMNDVQNPLLSYTTNIENIVYHNNSLISINIYQKDLNKWPILYKDGVFAKKNSTGTINVPFPKEGIDDSPKYVEHPQVRQGEFFIDEHDQNWLPATNLAGKNIWVHKKIDGLFKYPNGTCRYNNAIVWVYRKDLKYFTGQVYVENKPFKGIESSIVLKMPTKIKTFYVDVKTETTYTTQPQSIKTICKETTDCQNFNVADNNQQLNEAIEYYKKNKLIEIIN